MFTFLYSNANGFDIEFTAPTDEQARSALKSLGEHNLTFISKTLSFNRLHKLSFGSDKIIFNGVLSDDGRGAYIDEKNIHAFIQDLNGINNPDFMARLFDGNKLVIFNNCSAEIEEYLLTDGYFYLNDYDFDVISETRF